MKCNRESREAFLRGTYGLPQGAVMVPAEVAAWCSAYAVGA